MVHYIYPGELSIVSWVQKLKYSGERQWINSNWKYDDCGIKH